MPKLNTTTLSELSNTTEIITPSYDHREITAGIVHIGVGGFHRSHQAMYLDQLMNLGKALDWGIIGLGVMPSDVRMRDALAGQDHLYTLTTRDPEGTEATRVIGSIIDYRYAPDDPAAAVELLADPRIRILSLTVTEGGYNINHTTGQFMHESEHVAHDRAELSAGRLGNLRTFFGIATAALTQRRATNTPAFTIMSCDNISENGDVARTAFLSFADSIDPDLGGWIRQSVTFPNSMVDRITPETTDADREYIASRGCTDMWPVISEDFAQWVLEDSFINGRPTYEDVGVEIVPDVIPYELMKLRLLNISHQGLCYFAHLAGHRLVHEAMADKRFRNFLLAYMEQEASPTLPALPGVDLDSYRHSVIARFGNAAVGDTIARLCAETTDRIPKWLLPVIRENLKAGRSVRLSAAIIASWARYAEGVDEQGTPITVVDRLAERVTAAAANNRHDTLAFLRDQELFGDLADQPEFTEHYARALTSLHDVGAERTLDTLLER